MLLAAGLPAIGWAQYGSAYRPPDNFRLNQMASQRATRELNEHHNRLSTAVPRTPAPAATFRPADAAAPAANEGGWTAAKDKLRFLIAQQRLSRTPAFHTQLWQAALSAGYKREEVVKMFGETKDDYVVILAREARLAREAEARARGGASAAAATAIPSSTLGATAIASPTSAPSPAPASAAPPAPAPWLVPTLRTVGRAAAPPAPAPLPWSGSKTGSCQDACQEELRQGDGSAYVGNSHEGKPHGQGRLQREGLRYAGRFVAGEPRGEGRIDYANGAVYQGEVDGLLAHGNGRYTWADGSVVAGRFIRGALHGPAERAEQHELGTRKIQGHYDNGVPVGVHSMEFGSKSSLLRASLNYSEPAKSVLEYRNGDRFEGFTRGVIPSEGELQVRDGSRFKGSFHGQGRYRAGVLTLPDGVVQVGYWRDDEQRQGYAVVTWQDGTVAERMVHGNKAVGDMIETAPNGDVFSGSTVEPGFEVFGVLLPAGAAQASAVPKGRRPGQPGMEDLPPELAARARDVARAAAERLLPERARLEQQLGM